MLQFILTSLLKLGDHSKDGNCREDGKNSGNMRQGCNCCGGSTGDDGSKDGNGGDGSKDGNMRRGGNGSGDRDGGGGGNDGSTGRMAVIVGGKVNW